MDFFFPSLMVCLGPSLRKSIICPSPTLQIEKFCLKTLLEITTLKAVIEFQLLQVVPASLRLSSRT